MTAFEQCKLDAGNGLDARPAERKRGCPVSPPPGNPDRHRQRRRFGAEVGLGTGEAQPGFARASRGIMRRQ